jgi:hypothetical protein
MLQHRAVRPHRDGRGTEEVGEGVAALLDQPAGFGLTIQNHATRTSVDTPNPATSGHLKTGHHGSGRDVFILGLTGC